MYKLKEKYAEKGDMISILPSENGNVSVNLNGRDIKCIVPATFKDAQKERLIRAATQKELKYLYDRGSRLIEFIEEKPEIAEEKPTKSKERKPEK